MDARTELVSEPGQLEVVQVLLDHGADVDIEGGFDETPFLVATKMGRHEFMTYDCCWTMMQKYNKSVLNEIVAPGPSASQQRFIHWRSAGQSEPRAAHDNVRLALRQHSTPAALSVIIPTALTTYPDVPSRKE